MFLRRAVLNDAQSIAEVSVTTWKDIYKGLIPDDILAARNVTPKRIKQWEDRISRQENTVVFVVEENEKVVAFLWGGVGRDEKLVGNEIYALYVLPNYQKKGMGTALINEFKEAFPKENFYAFVLEGNPSASFYKKIGFTQDDNNVKQDGDLIEKAFVFKVK